ncbi:unnamed protein product [Trichogramma brassicae]|uniref:Uncharacterized protein n=1 Tax=Trichogramma brassicae TaxID=86971 RepID=A0A6H5J797_9HYME|nr:unnamed protein product [Trichogramma brassicae]
MIFIMTRSMTRMSDWRLRSAARQSRSSLSRVLLLHQQQQQRSIKFRRRRGRLAREKKKNKNFQGRRKSSRTMPFFGLFSFLFFRGNAYGLVKKKKKKKDQKEKKKISAIQAQSSRCLVRVVSFGSTAPKQCVWTCMKNAIGCCAGLTVRVRGERRGTLAQAMRTDLCFSCDAP